MKKFLLSVLFTLMLMTAMAIPNGKYQASNGDYIIVSGNRFELYIGGYYAVSLVVQNEEENGSFTYVVEGERNVRTGKWYTSTDGNTYLQLGNKTLKKTN